MNRFRTIIVENDLPFLESFTKMVADLPEIELIATCHDIETAKEKIEIEQPELVFLDIRLNGGDAFELLSNLQTIDFEIVFTTAYDEYALKAIELSALHYLLKPFGMAELMEVLSRMNKKRKTETLVQMLLSNLSKENPADYRIALKTQDGMTLVVLSDILYCEADNNYTTFYMKNDKKLMVSSTIKNFDEMLSGRNFLRIHQSYLVNLTSIKKVLKADGGSIELLNGVQLPVSRRKQDELKRAIQRIVIG